MRIAVVGAGGIGGYFGGRLASAGEDVRFLARGAHLAAMRERGLRVYSPLGDLDLAPSNFVATDDPDALGVADVVLFTVKSYDTDATAAVISPVIGPGTQVVSLQNGIDNEERLAKVYGWDHVSGGVAYIFSGIVEPGAIGHSGGPARIAFGRLDGGPSEQLDALLSACLGAGIDAAIDPDIRLALWIKYGFICAQAGLTAATRRSIGEIRCIPPTRALFVRVLEEAEAVGRAEGVPLPADIVERQMALADGLAPQLTSSLHDDLLGGRRMELEGLLGQLVRRAERAAVPAPTAAALYAVLLPQATIA